MKTQEKTLSATEFKAKCLKILDELDCEGVTITKRGKSIARVVPLSIADNSKFYGCLKGKIVVKGDIFSTGRKWNAKS
ncbi:MAG TPA: type II toxin-antitoxin system Phd/YefM family antitoxin [Terriglobia bacterium]|nr:type II toxin-antitoxin system Phd/YefM family antitoxin [Terriglobia bacterium]